MEKYTFIKNDTEDGSVITYSFEADTWHEILNNFVSFLRGSGFYVDSDSIGINEVKHIVDRLDIYNLTTFNNED